MKEGLNSDLNIVEFRLLRNQAPPSIVDTNGPPQAAITLNVVYATKDTSDITI